MTPLPGSSTAPNKPAPNKAGHDKAGNDKAGNDKAGHDKTGNDKTALHAYEPIGLLETISYGLGDCGFNLYWAPLTAFFMIYLTDIVGISPAAVGALMVTMRLASAVADPVFGAIADRTDTQYGRYRPWFLWLAVPLAAAGILAFSLADVPQGLKLIAVYVTLIFLNLVYTAGNVAYNALSGVITPESRQREIMMSLRFGGAFLTAVFITWLTPKLVAFTGPGQEALGWQFAMTIYGVILIAIFVNLFLNTQERFSQASEPRRNPFRDVGDLFNNRPWVVLFVLGAVVMVAFTLHMAATPYFVKYYVHRPELVTSFAMTFSLGLAAGSAATMLISRLMPRPLLLCAMLVILGGASLALYITPPAQLILLFAWQVVTGVALGTVSTMTFAMYADVADFNAWKTGHRATAMTYSMINFGKKIGAAVAGALIAWALSSQGYIANAAASAGLLDNIRLMMGLIPACLAFAGAVIALVYDLTPSAVARLQAEIMGGLTESHRS